MQASGHSRSMQTHRCFTCSTVPPSPPCGVRLQALFTSLKSKTPKQNPHTASRLTTTAVRTEAPVSSPVSPPTASASSSCHSTPSMDLFDDSHITWTPALILYFPFGCVLALARICLWITGIALDLPAFRNPEVISVYLRLLGVKVVWKNVERVPAGKHVLVSNHCSVGDLMMLFQGLPQRYVHLITTALPERVFGTSHLPVVLLPASADTFHALALTSSTNSPCSTAKETRCTPQTDLHSGLGTVQGLSAELHSRTERSLVGYSTAALHSDMEQTLVGDSPHMIQSRTEGIISNRHTVSSSSSSSSSSTSAHSTSPLESLAPLHSPLSTCLTDNSKQSNNTIPNHRGSEASSNSRSGSCSSSSNTGNASDSNMSDDPSTSSTATSRRTASTTLPSRSVSLPLGIEDMPIHLFPEGGMTNGRNGMMSFSRGFTTFAQDTPIVPVALRLHNPLGIRTHTLDSSFAANLFWFSFPPWVELQATALPVMEQEAGEGKAAFVVRLQAVIAQELGFEQAAEDRMSIRQKRQLIQQRAGKKVMQSPK